MKSARNVVGVLAALAGVAACVGGWLERHYSSYKYVYLDQATIADVIFVWMSVLSIVLWAAFLILYIFLNIKKSKR